jgi:hypothetical protein
VGVHEHDGVGEVVIVVDDVAEVDLVQLLASNGSGIVVPCGAHTIASRPLFFGILFSALGLSTSYITSGASGISFSIQLISSFCVFGITILNV